MVAKVQDLQKKSQERKRQVGQKARARGNKLVSCSTIRTHESVVVFFSKSVP